MDIERFRGCLLGHAVGDALGAPVEFLSRSQILRALGPEGVCEFLPWSTGALVLPPGSYTDDTQMMLATANALLESAEDWRRSGVDTTAERAHSRYLDWLREQDDPAASRHPGTTCLTALRSGHMGTIDDPLNDRKGAGGIMRVGPAGLAREPERAFETGVELAAITHGHATGYLAAGFFADVISRVVRGAAIHQAVADTREVLIGWDDADETLAAVDLAVELFISDVHPTEAIGRIGQGWIAEESLGIALMCALSYPEDWAPGTLAAVNITGDSDTTGALTGALLGARLGVGDIPEDWLRTLEDSEAIRRLADQIFEEFGAA